MSLGLRRAAVPAAMMPSRVPDRPSQALRDVIAQRCARCVLTLAMCALAVAFNAHAQSNLPVPKAEDDEWKELGTTPPAYPRAVTLVKFPTDRATQEVFVDTATLAIAADSVVRYVLVIKSSSGAENVSYEGLRCDTGQRRVYAFGRRDGTWSVARNSDWRAIEDARINRHYFEFWRDLFCDGKATEPRADILRNLPRGGRPRQSSGPSE